MTMKTPFGDLSMPFTGMLIVASLLLISVTTYLHIFFGYWLDLERERRHLNLVRNEQAIPCLPTLFSFNDPLSRLLTGFIFYWLAPLVFGLLALKRAVRPAWGREAALITGLVWCLLLFLQIRRCSQPNRKRWELLLLWAALLLVGVRLVLLSMFGLQQFHRPWELFRADLKGAWLAHEDFNHVDLRLASLQEANLLRANLEGANLAGANLEKAILWGTRLRGANLLKANLQEGGLEGADLQEADLGGANLQKANLLGAKLQKATLSVANLQGATLTLAELQQANLRGADLEKADLLGAKLQKATLWGANLQEASLGQANLEGANLQAARLRGANLAGANLTGANLGGANLTGTNLTLANLIGADLTYATGLTKEQLQRAVIDGTTRLPGYLRVLPQGQIGVK